MNLSFTLLSFLLSLAPQSVLSFTSPRSTSTQQQQQQQQLNLFGGGGSKGADGGGGENKPMMGGGMMEQMAMMKKAQEIAQTKRKLDEELSKMDFSGANADGTVTIDIQFSPSTNPMDPNPSYTASAVTFDDAFFESAAPADLAAAVKEALQAGIETTNLAVTEKYQSMSASLMDVMKKQ